MFYWNTFAFLMIQLISGSSASCKSSLNIWKFTVPILLKPGLEMFSITLLACDMIAAVSSLNFIWHCPSSGLENDRFQSCSHCWVFQICGHIEYSALTASSFRIWNSSTGIPSHLLALFVVMLPKAQELTSHYRMSGSRWMVTPLWLSGSWRSFFV